MILLELYFESFVPEKSDVAMKKTFNIKINKV